MLNVQLYTGEFLTIGENVRVHFKKSNMRDSITLSVEAPRDVLVLRPKHIQCDLESLAQQGDREAQATLNRIYNAKQEREARVEARRAMKAG
jgi:sRNA-binding carbon storage regulator CsrA